MINIFSFDFVFVFRFTPPITIFVVEGYDKLNYLFDKERSGKETFTKVITCVIV